MLGWIALAIVVWLGIGVGGIIFVDDMDLTTTRYRAAAFTALFWPVTLPIFLAFGIAYAIWSAFRFGIGWFRG